MGSTFVFVGTLSQQNPVLETNTLDSLDSEESSDHGIAWIISLGLIYHEKKQEKHSLDNTEAK